jgi:hypothetical protein
MATFIVLRKNKLGMNYRITQARGEQFTRVRTGDKEMRFNTTVGDMNRGWYKWFQEGKLIQDAFPFLTSDEREFIQSGITPMEFAELFKDEEQ